MRKICILLNAITSGNGVARAALSVAALLKDEGFDVTLIPLYQCDSSLVKRIIPNVAVKRVYGFYFRGFSVVSNIAPLSFYHKYLNLDTYDTLIAFQYGLSTKIVSSYKNKRDREIVKIGWMHGYDEGLKLRKYYTGFDKLICVSRFNAERLKKEMGPCNKPIIDYSYNPIDDKRVYEQGCESINFDCKKRPLFICVGRQSQEKGYLRLISIMGTLRNNGYNFELWMVGDGPEHNELVKLTESFGLTENIRFIGSQINPHKYTSRGDVFICSSYSEGYSTACTEAIMLGIPVITTSVSGGEEIIRDSESGILTGIDDESLQKGIKQVLDNPSLIVEWKNTLKHTKEKFSLASRKEKLLSIIE